MSYLSENLKRAFKILFHYDENARLNLFEFFPFIKNFFLKRKNLFYIRTIGDISFTFLIFLGLFGPQEADRNIMLFISWGIWWTSIVLSWFFVGRLWCGFCPFPGIGRIFQHLGLSFNLEVPYFLRKYCPHISVILLALIIYVEEVTDMKNWPAGTAYLLLSILTGATFSAILFKGQAWCRHLCPMGKIIGSASTISIMEFRPEHTLCKRCKTFSCKKGRDGLAGCPVYLGAFNVRNNLYCLICGRCLFLCESDSPRINLRNPFVELIINKGRHLTCLYIIPFLIGSQLARFSQHHEWYREVKALFLNSNLLTFSVFLVIGFFFFVILTKFSSRLFGLTEDEIFGKFSPMVPVLVPLAFTGELVYRLEYLLSNVGDFFPTFGRQFGVSLEHLTFSISATFINLFCTTLLTTGALACHYVLYLFYRGDFEGVLKKPNFFILNSLVVMVYFTYIVAFSF